MSWVRPGPPLYIMAPPLPQWRPTGHKCSQSHFLPTPPNSFLVTMATYTRMLFGERKRSTWALRVDLVPFGKDGPGSWMSFQKRGEGQAPGVHTAPTRGHRALGTGRNASAAWGGTDGPLRDLRAVGRARTCASLPLPPFGLTCLEPPRLISELHKSDIWTGMLMYEETATERPRSGTPATFRGRVHFRPGPVPAEQSARAHTRMTSSGAPPTHTGPRPSGGAS